MLKYAFSLVFLFSSFALAESETLSKIKTVTDKFDLTMVKCPEKIWPNYSWNGLKVVFINRSQSLSWVWDASTNTIEPIDNALLDSSVLGSSYNFFKLNGSDALSLDMEDEHSKDDLFSLGVHEFFHNQGQKGWMRNYSAKRGTEYPVKWEPRLYRRMLFDNLAKHFLTGDNKHLSKAKFWFNKWKNEYSDEFLNSTDSSEGTAEYVESFAIALSELGCETPLEKIKEFLKPKVQSDYASTFNGDYFRLDREGYDIGGLASHILRFSSSPIENWTDQIVKGESPLSILLEKLEPTAEAAPTDLVEKFKMSAKKINADYGALLDQDIANWTDKSFIRLATSYQLLQSNLMPQFFAKSSQLGLALYPYYFAHKFASTDGKTSFTLKEKTVVFGFRSNLCNEGSYTLVHSSHVKFVDGTAYITAPNAEGKIFANLVEDENGFKYLCTKQ